MVGDLIQPQTVVTGATLPEKTWKVETRVTGDEVGVEVEEVFVS